MHFNLLNYFFGCSNCPILTQREALHLTTNGVDGHPAIGTDVQAGPVDLLPQARAPLPPAPLLAIWWLKKPSIWVWEYSRSWIVTTSGLSRRSWETCRKRKRSHKLIWTFPVCIRGHRAQFSQSLSSLPLRAYQHINVTCGFGS